MLSNEILLRESNPKSPGVFLLNKAEFIVEGVNSPRTGRCDNVSFAPVSVAKDTEYENHVLRLNTTNSAFAVERIRKFEIVIDAAPVFYISYIETASLNNESIIQMEDHPEPSTMWAAKSIFQLLKNMREWSYLVDEDFGSDHPMARYSKMAIDELSIPESILNEIDSWPDMHLSKFFKGYADYKKIPFPYPEPSEELKTWILNKVSQYSKKTLEEQIDLI